MKSDICKNNLIPTVIIQNLRAVSILRLYILYDVAMNGTYYIKLINSTSVCLQLPNRVTVVHDVLHVKEMTKIRARVQRPLIIVCFRCKGPIISHMSINCIGTNVIYE